MSTASTDPLDVSTFGVTSSLKSSDVSAVPSRQDTQDVDVDIRDTTSVRGGSEEEQGRESINDDQVTELRKQISHLQSRCEDLESQKAESEASVLQLKGALDSFQRMDAGEEGVYQLLVEKSMQLAEISSDVDRLNRRVKYLSLEKDAIASDRDDDHERVVALNCFVKSFLKAAGDDDDFSTDQRTTESVIADIKLSIKTLGAEKLSYQKQSNELEQTIARMVKDYDLKNVKVGMLEEIIGSLSSAPSPSRSMISSHQHKRRSRRNAPVKCRSLSPHRSSSRQEDRTAKHAPYFDNDITTNASTAPKCDDSFYSSPSSPPRISRPPSILQPSLSCESGLSYDSNDGSLSSVTSGAITRVEQFSMEINGMDANYSGPLCDGLPHGVGTLRFENGDTYLGEMALGEMHGKGTMYYRLKEKGIDRGNYEHNEFIGR